MPNRISVMVDIEKNKKLARDFLSKFGIKVMKVQLINLLLKIPVVMIQSLGWAGNPFA